MCTILRKQVSPLFVQISLIWNGETFMEFLKTECKKLQLDS